MQRYDMFAVMQNRLRETGVYTADGTTLVDAELTAYSAGLQMIMEKYEMLAKELFIPTAECYGLTMREGMTGCSLSHLPLEQRRVQLLQQMAVSGNDYAVSALEAQLDSFGITAYLTEHPAEKSITVTITDSSRMAVQSQAAVKAAAETVLPAHLAIVYDFSRVNLTA